MKKEKVVEKQGVNKVNRKKVQFAEGDSVYSIPGWEEDRRGTWALDALRERMRRENRCVISREDEVYKGD